MCSRYYINKLRVVYSYYDVSQSVISRQWGKYIKKVHFITRYN
jgi:hypothetical protein